MASLRALMAGAAAAAFVAATPAPAPAPAFVAAAPAPAPAPAATITCDVLIAGGSLASLAAAVTAANASTTLRVCLLDPTDWPGGQLTASAVPAVDFGPDNARPENNAASFAAFLWGPQMEGATNLGACWVSRKCFSPRVAMEQFITPLLASLPNLALYLNTTVTHAYRDAASGNVTGVDAVQRTPAPGTTGWEALTSAMLDDWYVAAPSAAFPTKAALRFVVPAGGVVIEGTEFGDVLMTAGLPVAQGVEVPLENSTSLMSYCGQGTTIPFYVEYGHAPAPRPDPWPPGGPGGLPWAQQGMSWQRDWTYRRVFTEDRAATSHAVEGDVSVINVGGGNDLDNAYLFYDLASPELAAQLAAPGAWRGGINLTAYAMAEQRS